MTGRGLCGCALIVFEGGAAGDAYAKEVARSKSFRAWLLPSTVALASRSNISCEDFTSITESTSRLAWTASHAHGRSWTGATAT